VGSDCQLVDNRLSTSRRSSESDDDILVRQEYTVVRQVPDIKGDLSATRLRSTKGDEKLQWYCHCNTMCGEALHSTQFKWRPSNPIRQSSSGDMIPFGTAQVETIPFDRITVQVETIPFDRITVQMEISLT